MTDPQLPVFIGNDELSELLCDILARGSSCRFQSKGHSMSPFIEDSDILTVSPLADQRIGFGSVVVFISPETGKVAVHRVVGSTDKHFLTRGDNAVEADKLLPRKNILGIVSCVERNGRMIRLGLGIERVVIASLSRTGLLSSFISLWRKVRRRDRNLSLKE
jgi:hypothetical protein